MPARQGQSVFAKGEVSPEIEARMDVAAYGSGVRSGLNVYVRKYGGLSKRLGTRFVAEAHDATKPVRLIPFEFSITQTYALELGQGYMRPITVGGMVVEEEVAIQGITAASNAVVHSPFHGLDVGDEVYLKSGDGEMGDRLNNIIWTVTAVPDADHFAIDARTFGLTFTSWSGGVTRVSPPPAPPAPPSVPAPVDPPAPPDTGGGGGGGSGDFDRPPGCVAADRTMIRLANSTHDGPGGERIARMVKPFDWVWTVDTREGREVAAMVGNVVIEKAMTYSAAGVPDATAGHRSWIGGGWKRSDEVGVEAGEDYVWKAEILKLHTFYARHVDSPAWVLSHNIKDIGF